MSTFSAKNAAQSCRLFDRSSTGERLDIQWWDNYRLVFGDGADLYASWDGTDFDVVPAANNTVMKLGNGTYDFDVWVYGSAAANYLLWDASANSLIVKGVGAQLDVGTFASLLKGSGVAISSSKTGALSVYADDNGANIAESVRAIRGRMLLTYDQTGGSIRAVQGQLKLADGIDVTSGIYTGVQGYVEMAATHSAKTGSTFSAIDSSTEIGTALTIDSGGEYFGIHVETTGSGTITNNGTCGAIGITKASGAASWPVGLWVDPDSVIVPIKIGTSSSTAQSGFPLSSSQTTVIGSYADDNNTTLGDAVYANIHARTMLFKPCTAGTIIGVRGHLKYADEADMGPGVFAAVQGYQELYDDLDVKSGGKFWGVDSSIEAPSGGILTVNSGGIAAGLHAELTGAGQAVQDSGGILAGLYVDEAITTGSWGYGAYFVGSALSNGISLGTSAVPITLAATTNYALSIATTSAIVTASEYDAVKINAVQTGAAAIPVALRVNLESNVKLGNWANAAYISLDLKTNGGVAGLGTVVCAELTMGAAATEGTFGVFEGEINCPASWTGTGPVSYLYLNSYGATAANFDTYGYLFTITGCTSGSGKFWYDNTANAADEFIKVKTPSGDRYLILSDDVSFA